MYILDEMYITGWEGEERGRETERERDRYCDVMIRLQVTEPNHLYCQWKLEKQFIGFHNDSTII